MTFSSHGSERIYMFTLSQKWNSLWEQQLLYVTLHLSKIFKKLRDYFLHCHSLIWLNIEVTIWQIWCRWKWTGIILKILIALKVTKIEVIIWYPINILLIARQVLFGNDFQSHDERFHKAWLLSGYFQKLESLILINYPLAPGNITEFML